MCMLQGVTMLQVEAMPIWGLAKSASLNPAARSIARLGACSTPSVTMREYLRKSLSVMVFPQIPIRRPAARDKMQRNIQHSASPRMIVECWMHPTEAVRMALSGLDWVLPGWRCCAVHAAMTG